jgi:hypothetical protein
MSFKIHSARYYIYYGGITSPSLILDGVSMLSCQNMHFVDLSWECVFLSKLSVLFSFY